MKRGSNHVHKKSKNLLEKEFSKFVKLLTGFKYPKLFVLVLMIILSYWIFKNPVFDEKISSLHELSYLGFFIAGLLFSFGFSTPLAIGFFIIAEPSNIYLAASIAGVGALISDYIILKSIRISFLDEFHRIQKIKIISSTNKLIKHSLGKRITVYLTYIFAGIIIASPLPDEIGVSMLAGLTEINEKVFLALDFIFNSAGVLIILLLASI